MRKIRSEHVPLVVLGDFNRRMNLAGDDVWADLDDGDPDLTKFTEGRTSACMNFRFPECIDHIVADTRATALVRPGSFEQVLFTTVDPGATAHLSDHCPIAAVFETEAVTPAAGDPIDDLLARIDEVQADLQAIREGVSALRE
jgi:endonuclease/exonuclease/phosphatase family metal-dependent hydrolase